MPGSPEYIFKGLGFTVSELQAMGREVILKGRISGTGGSGRNESFALYSAEKLSFEISAEIRRLTGDSGPKRIEQRLF